MGYKLPWGKLRTTPAAKLWLLTKTFCQLLAARFALHFLPVSRIIAWKQRKLRDCTLQAPQRAELLHQVRWAVLVVARYSPVRFVCFPQCLAASALLGREGVPSRLHYGVRRGTETAKLETHTWLEVDGEVILGGEIAGQFSTLNIYS